MPNKIKTLIQKLQILSDALPEGYVQEAVLEDMRKLKLSDDLYLTLKNKYNV